MHYFNKYYFIYLLGTSLLLASCKEIPDLGNFDQAAWKADKQGCNNQRKKLLEDFKRNQDKLIRLGQNQILEILGKPDFTEIYRRGQLYYFYFYAPDRPCRGEEPDLLGGNLVRIRFDALDRVSEILIR